MPDDAASLEDTLTDSDEGDVPSQEQPAEPAQPDPYEKRYEDLRSQYDRMHPRYNQYEQVIQGLSDPEQAPEILRAFGFDIEDDDAPEADDDLDPEDRFEQRFGKIEGYLQEQAERAEQAELDQLESAYFDQEFKRLEVDEEDRETIEALAREMPDEEGIPDVEAAVQKLNAFAEARFKRYTKSKKAPRVESGKAGTEKIDMNDEDAVLGHMADLIEAGIED